MGDSNTLAGWRRELQQLHDSLMDGRERFYAWFEETALVEAEIKTETEEIRQLVADIKMDRQRYRRLITHLPKVEKFSAEEIEKRSEKASELLELAGEIAVMEIHLPRKIDKLRFLLEHPSQ